MAEARTGKRFPLQLPIKIHREEDSARSQRNHRRFERRRRLHPRGCFARVGSPVEFEIALPPEVTGGKRT